MVTKQNIMLMYMKDRIKHLILFSTFLFIFFAIFAIYRLPMNTFLYAAIICLSVGMIYMTYDFYKFHAKQTHLQALQKSVAAGLENLPNPTTLEEYEYQELLRILHKEQQLLVLSTDKKHKDLIEYYTLWTHQIKTPLAAISLLLQSDNQKINQELELQILEVEKYVDMALQYLRIDYMYSDLTLEKYSIQKIVKKAVKSYSKTFIYKGIAIEMNGRDQIVLTDEKWLLFVLKQILSNSLKYTNTGKISIEIKNDSLIIQDTGIGIRSEDIPRIFEKGFTGYSGRIEEKSTGLGLYLSKRILDNLGHSIEISSAEGLGTRVKIGLSRAALEIE